jgi:hypothetical protein
MYSTKKRFIVDAPLELVDEQGQKDIFAIGATDFFIYPRKESMGQLLTGLMDRR